MKRSFREIRLHSDKSPQQFLCDLLHQGNKQVVLRYISSDIYTVGAIKVEKGTVTIAHYWGDRNYTLWILKKPDASLIGYLFHIVRDVEIGEDYVRYVDLELDIWFTPDGIPRVLDEDEVNDYYNKGVFDNRTLSLIEEQKMYIMNKFHTIIRDVWSGEELS